MAAAGYSTTALNTPDFAVARYNSDNSFDPSFDGDRRVTAAIATGRDDYALSVRSNRMARLLSQALRLGSYGSSEQAEA